MQMESYTGAVNPLTEFVRGAFGRIARPSLWKRRRELSICETLSLGNRNFLAIIGYRDRRFLIAGTPTSISLLADITPAKTAEGDSEQEEVPTE